MSIFLFGLRDYALHKGAFFAGFLRYADRSPLLHAKWTLRRNKLRIIRRDRERHGSFTPLFLLFRANPLRWALRGAVAIHAPRIVFGRFR